MSDAGAHVLVNTTWQMADLTLANDIVTYRNTLFIWRSFSDCVWFQISAHSFLELRVFALSKATPLTVLKGEF